MWRDQETPKQGGPGVRLREVRLAARRQINAGLNICRTALAQLPNEVEMRELRGLRLDPDALTNDAMILLYTPGNAGAHEVSGRPGSIERGNILR
jgi:hypothetical protein